MEFQELELKNFGKFHNEIIRFQPGMNVIYGSNGAGKSTIYQALKAQLFGMEKARGRAKNDPYSRYEPWENPSYYAASLYFTKAGNRYRIERSYHKSEKRTVCLCETTGEVLDVGGSDLTDLLDGITENSYRNTMSIGQLQAETDSGLLHQLQNYTANYYGSGSANVDVEQALAYLRTQKKTAGKQLTALEETRDRQKQQLENRQTRLLKELQQREESLHREREECESMEESLQYRKRMLQSVRDGILRVDMLQNEGIQKLNRLYEQQRQTELELEASAVKAEQEQARQNNRGEASDEELNERSDGGPVAEIRLCGKMWLVTLILAVLTAVIYLTGRGSISVWSRALRILFPLLTGVSLLGTVGMTLHIRSVIRSRNERKRKTKGERKPEENRKSEGDRKPEESQAWIQLQHWKQERKRINGLLEAQERELRQYADQEAALHRRETEAQQQWEEESAVYHRLQGQIAQQEEDLREQKVKTENLEEQLEELHQTSPKMRELEQSRRIAEIAERHILEAAEELHQQFGYELNRRASHILEAITEGEYARMLLEDDGTIYLFREGRRIPVESVSRGTLEQVYFALRMAVLDTLYRESLPVILDDTFAYYDEQRLESTLRWLLRNRQQVILFTCRKRELDLVQKLQPGQILEQNGFLQYGTR